MPHGSLSWNLKTASAFSPPRSSTANKVTPDDSPPRLEVPLAVVVDYIDGHRERVVEGKKLGVESICAVLNDAELRRLRSAESPCPAQPRGNPRGSLHGRAADAPEGLAGTTARQAAEDHHRCCLAFAGGPGRPSLHCRPAEPALGSGHHLYPDVFGMGVCRVRHRCVLENGRRLAGVNLPTAAFNIEHSLYRAFGGSGSGRLGGFARSLLGLGDGQRDLYQTRGASLGRIRGSRAGAIRCRAAHQGATSCSSGWATEDVIDGCA